MRFDWNLSKFRNGLDCIFVSPICWANWFLLALNWIFATPNLLDTLFSSCTRLNSRHTNLLGKLISSCTGLNFCHTNLLDKLISSCPGLNFLHTKLLDKLISNNLEYLSHQLVGQIDSSCTGLNFARPICWTNWFFLHWTEFMLHQLIGQIVIFLYWSEFSHILVGQIDSSYTGLNFVRPTCWTNCFILHWTEFSSYQTYWKNCFLLVLDWIFVRLTFGKTDSCCVGLKFRKNQTCWTNCFLIGLEWIFARLTCWITCFQTSVCALQAINIIYRLRLKVIEFHQCKVDANG